MAIRLFDGMGDATMENLCVQCPSCGHSNSVDSQRSGRQGRCRSCGKTLNSVAAEGGPSAAFPAQPSPALPLPATAAINVRIGRFEIRAKLGPGGFGAVYPAYDPVLDREVALKVPHEGSLNDCQDRQRFIREAKAAAQLFHPNIVPVFDSGTDGPHQYIASAFIPGQTLAETVKAGPFEPSRAARVVMQLADALNYAHSR
jgi:serine/threonine protein kinase